MAQKQWEPALVECSNHLHEEKEQKNYTKRWKANQKQIKKNQKEMLFLTIFYKPENPSKFWFIISECTKSVIRFNVSVSTIGMMQKFSRLVLECYQKHLTINISF